MQLTELESANSSTGHRFPAAVDCPAGTGAAWQASLEQIQRPTQVLPENIAPFRQVKWGVVTHVLADRPGAWNQLQPMLIPHDRPPRANDVLVGRVVDIGRNSSVELSSGRKAELYLGDVIVGAFGNRYATSQYEGRVPEKMAYYHMLSQGAVFGQVVSAAYSMSNPTIIEPLGYLASRNGEVLNLTQLGVRQLTTAPRVPTLLVIGSSMDAGKTTTVANLVHGLSQAGWQVHAGKLTGTGCAKDIHKMLDAGATKSLDFTYCGYCSTAGISDQELRAISSTLISHLSEGQPDMLVLEIADGIIQQETERLVKMLVAENKVDGAILAIHDVLSVALGTEIVQRRLKLFLVGVSGAVTKSPLSVAELRSATDLPVFDMPTLAQPSIQFAMEPLLRRFAQLEHVGETSLVQEHWFRSTGSGALVQEQY